MVSGKALKTLIEINKWSIFTPDFGFENVCIAVYVKEVQQDYENIRRDLMRHVGGQDKCYCATHRLPLISAYKSSLKCVCPIENISRDYCERRVSLCCPELNCSVGVCKRCSNTESDEIVYVSPVQNDDVGLAMSISGESISSDDSSSDDDSSDDLHDPIETDENDRNNEMEFDPLIELDELATDANNANETTDEVFDDSNYANADENLDGAEDNFDDFIPTTNAADTPFVVEEVEVDEKRKHYVSGHVILNQIGSLLDRGKHRIRSTQSQKYFIQGLASVIQYRMEWIQVLK